MLLPECPPSTLLLLTLPLSALPLSAPSPVFTLHPPLQTGSWFKNLAVRPKNLANRPSTKPGSLHVSVSGAYNLTGIDEATACPHSHGRPFPKAGCNNAEAYIFGSFHIPAPMQATPAAPNDTEAASIYLMDIETGSYTTPLANLTGINGIRFAPGYIYRADYASQVLSRVPVGADADAVATGPTETGEGKTYIAAMYENKVVEVAFGAAASGSRLGVKRVAAENLMGTGMGLVTVVVFGRRKEDAECCMRPFGREEEIVVIDPSK
ncbi:hypothetical protein VTI74DRAFT_11548 [Chaetomium olivicolor]